MKNLILPLIFILGLSGCAEHVSERYGTEIQVVPVTYSIDVEIKDKKSKEAWNELDDYVKKHWDMVATQMVSIYWNSKSGKQLAEKYAKYLLSQGIDSHKLFVQESRKGSSAPQFKQDLRLETVVNKAIVSTCGYESIGNFGVEANGCYAEGARWQSMVNPEKMLTQK